MFSYSRDVPRYQTWGLLVPMQSLPPSTLLAPSCVDTTRSVAQTGEFVATNAITHKLSLITAREIVQMKEFVTTFSLSRAGPLDAALGISHKLGLVAAR